MIRHRCFSDSSLPHTHIQLSPTLATIGTLMFITGTAFAQDVSFSQKPFTDVPKTNTYFESVEYLRTQKILKGYTDGTFRPDTRINRAEFVMFVVNPFIIDTNNLSDCLRTNAPDNAKTVFFSDVQKDAWYAPQVCFAKARSLINGYPDGTYRPAASINFVEAAKILSNVFSLDVQDIETGEFWYRAYVRDLSARHAIPASIRRFDQTITRGEMAEMVFRLKTHRTDKASADFAQLR